MSLRNNQLNEGRLKSHQALQISGKASANRCHRHVHQQGWQGDKSTNGSRQTYSGRFQVWSQHFYFVVISNVTVMQINYDVNFNDLILSTSLILFTSLLTYLTLAFCPCVTCTLLSPWCDSTCIHISELTAFRSSVIYWRNTADKDASLEQLYSWSKTLLYGLYHSFFNICVCANYSLWSDCVLLSVNSCILYITCNTFYT